MYQHCLEADTVHSNLISDMQCNLCECIVAMDMGSVIVMATELQDGCIRNLCMYIVRFSNQQRSLIVQNLYNQTCISHQLRTFLQEFCALMGEHFTALADKEEKENSSRHTPLISESSTSGMKFIKHHNLWCVTGP